MRRLVTLSELCPGPLCEWVARAQWISVPSPSLSLFHHKTVFIKRKRLVLLLAMSYNKQNRLGVGAGKKKAGGQ